MRRAGFTILEALLALLLTVTIVGFLWSAIGAAVRGAGRAEELMVAERRVESFQHILREELRRANHLITTDPSGRRLHDPRFSAVWILEEGAGVGARVFEADQRVPDPLRAEIEALRQDRVFFLLRGRELVMVRSGELSEPEVKVLLEEVRSLRFASGSPEGADDALDGLLTVTLELGPEDGKATVEREFAVPLGVPVLRVDSPPPGSWVPAPTPGDE